MARGRDLLFQVLEAEGIEYLFGNPGTTELPVVDGCTAYPRVRYIMALHEDIAIGMAMGYARATGKVGVVNVHVAPGLAHGLGNLYNAWRAGIPLVVTAGQQHTRLAVQEPILTADLVAMARPFTKWAYEVRHREELPVVLHRAFKEALSPPPGPVFLSLPVDVMLEETDDVAPPITRVSGRLRGDPEALEQAATILATAKNPLIVAGDGVGLDCAWAELGELAERLGAPVYTEAFSTLANFPNNHPHWVGVLPSDPDGMRQVFAGVDVALLCGFTTQAPVAHYDGQGPLIPTGVKLVYLHHHTWEIGKNHPGTAAVLGDVRINLQALNILLARHLTPDPRAVYARTKAVRARAAERRARWERTVASTRNQVPVAAVQVAAELARVFPPDGILASEAISNAGAFTNLVPFRDPLSLWAGKGGGLGHSTPAAIGLKLGAPSRTVVNVVGDGTFLYYPQTLWTAAHLALPVLIVILNNRTYQILKEGLRAMGGPWGPSGTYPPGLDIAAPEVDFVALAASFGVAAERVTAPDQLRPALERGLTADRPYLIDVIIE